VYLGRVDEVAERLDRVLARVREHGFRMTPQRVAVIRALVESTAHPSIEQVYLQLLPEYPMMSLATVYKTVALMQELEEVIELAADDGGIHWDGRRPDPHPHLVCTGCGQIVDVELERIDELVHKVLALSGFGIVTRRIDFWGVCARCQSRE
jgi:Fur family peroxide stress response transcriptional regulator